MQLRILGCSGGIGQHLRTSSYLIDDDILLDAGTGVGDLSLDEMRKIRRIFITHSHMEHIVSIPLLIDTLFSSLRQPAVSRSGSPRARSGAATSQAPVSVGLLRRS